MREMGTEGRGTYGYGMGGLADREDAPRGVDPVLEERSLDHGYADDSLRLLRELYQPTRASDKQAGSAL